MPLQTFEIDVLISHIEEISKKKIRGVPGEAFQEKMIECEVLNTEEVAL